MRPLLVLLLLPIASPAAAWGDCEHRAERRATLEAGGLRSLVLRAGAGGLEVIGEKGRTTIEAVGSACADSAERLDQIRLDRAAAGWVATTRRCRWWSACRSRWRWMPRTRPAMPASQVSRRWRWPTAAATCASRASPARCPSPTAAATSTCARRPDRSPCAATAAATSRSAAWRATCRSRKTPAATSNCATSAARRAWAATAAARSCSTRSPVTLRSAVTAAAAFVQTALVLRSPFARTAAAGSPMRGRVLGIHRQRLRHADHQRQRRVVATHPAAARRPGGLL